MAWERVTVTSSWGAQQTQHAAKTSQQRVKKKTGKKAPSRPSQKNAHRAKQGAFPWSPSRTPEVRAPRKT